MTNKEQFVAQVEHDLRSTRGISAETRELWRNLDDEARRAFARAMDFPAGDAAHAPGLTHPEDRRTASRMMLLKMGLDTPNPRWSSEVLERFVSSALTAPGTSLNEVFSPLLGLLGESSRELTPPVAHFLKDLVILCFTRFRSEYDQMEWNAFVELVSSQPTPSRCYLALIAVPPQHLPASVAELILSTLASTPYANEAKSLLVA